MSTRSFSKVTGKNPSIIPTEWEFLEGGTEKYRGVAKYAMARNYFDVPSPEAWLFGREYSRIKTGNAKNLAEVTLIRPTVPIVGQAGAAIFEQMLFGRFLEWDTPSSRKPQEAMTFEKLEAAVKASRLTKGPIDKD